jgi:hypothetical protein
MAASSSNILVGAAAIAIGSGTPTTSVDGIVAAIKTATTTTPKNFQTWVQAQNNTALGTTGVTFRDVGYTQEGVEINYQPDYGEVEVDQYLDAAKLFKQKMTVNVSTTFAEATLENLLVVWDQSSEKLSTPSGYKELYLAPGNLGDTPNEKVLAFAGQAPLVTGASRQRLYVATRSVAMEASSHALRRNEATVFPVNFRLLPDGNSSYSAYGKIVDVA